jgi:hypothetical protein
MSEVTKTVEELEYFFKTMVEKELKPSEFTHNLNAFIVRGRSVTLIMQKQYSKHPEFPLWYSHRVNEMKEDKLMRFFVDCRNVSLKEHSIKPDANFIARHITITNDKEGHEKHLDIPMDGSTPVLVERDMNGNETRTLAPEYNSHINRQYYFREPKPPKVFRNLQVTELCRIYLDNLRELAKQAIAQFENKQLNPFFHELAHKVKIL